MVVGERTTPEMALGLSNMLGQRIGGLVGTPPGMSGRSLALPISGGYGLGSGEGSGKRGGGDNHIGGVKGGGDWHDGGVDGRCNGEASGGAWG
ncbi:hypothetical protein GUJ93_ZPchr0004g39689 [Zizania palustris]|uniref:Uncharacterized protein n=1 Tax=Zizania palustris TaxID=103762 RepID=A0A8J5VZJ8_ZIZPA|nr:hypothetical protein GUJ93_ZPchr0004g39689 [Zizania palustris]